MQVAEVTTRKSAAALCTTARAYAFSSLPLKDVDGKRVVPTEFRVFAAGENKTLKGTFLFTERSAESVMQHYRESNIPLMGDYEHQTNAPDLGFPPVIAPASITEMVPEIRRDESGRPELWVTNVKWTDRARGFLESGEYRLFSPTFLHDTKTNEILALLRISLTNDPAMLHQTPLVAATASGAATSEKEKNMNENTCASCAALREQLEQLTASVAVLTQKNKELEEELLKCGKTTERVKELTGKESEAEQLGVLSAFAEKARQYDELVAKMKEEKLAMLKSQYESQSREAIATGKLPAATKATLDKIAEEDGIERAMSFLTSFLSTAQPAVRTAELRPADEGAVTLTAAELQVASKLGIKTEDMLAAKQRHLGLMTAK